MAVIHITEAEFQRFAKRRRAELAQEITESGVSLYELAKGTRMKWDTIRRISQGKPAHTDTQERVRCYLETIKAQRNNEENQNQSQSICPAAE